MEKKVNVVVQEGPVNKLSIPEELHIFDYKSYEDIPAAKKAWVTIKAKQQGKDPVMVHAGIKAKMAKDNNNKEIKKSCYDCEVSFICRIWHQIEENLEFENDNCSGFITSDINSSTIDDVARAIGNKCQHFRK